MKAFGAMGLAMAGVLLTATALAQGPGGGMGPGPGMGPEPGFGEHRPPMERAFGAPGDHGRWWNNPKVVERLKLTDEQRKAFDGILLDHRAKLIDLRASLEKAELTMEPLMSDDPPNEAKILAQIDKVAQARAELEKANAGFLLAIRAKLTPEQWKQMQAFRTDRAHAGRGAMERGPGDGGMGPGGWRPGGQGAGGQHHYQYQYQAHPPAPPDAAPPTPPAPGSAPGAGAEQ
ncbi:MAG: Spy/CpxP family protein refolding chaperone [Terracidiphilus sp.]